MLESYYLHEAVLQITTEDIRAITDGWRPTNRRRGALIAREIAGLISPREQAELTRLEWLAELVVDTTTDQSGLEELKRVHAEIVLGKPRRSEP